MFKKNLTIVEKAVATVPQFKKLHATLARDFNISGKAKSTYNNYIRCLAYLALNYQTSPEQLDTEQVKDYLNYCKNQHDTPSNSFFKHTVCLWITSCLQMFRN